MNRPPDRESCPLCDRKTSARIQPHPDFAGLHIWCCSHCEFWFGAPRPRAEQLADYYRTVYGQRRTWATSAPYLAIMRRRARAQTSFIQPRRHRIRTAIDIGCGVGALVASLARRGVEAVGFDSDANAIATGREVFGANIHQGHVEQVEGDQHHDLLCLSHVVEHFADPVADLHQLLAVVRPGAFLFIEVPQCNPWMFDRRVPTESHLGFFTLRSLNVLARRLKLKVLRAENCGPCLQSYYERGPFTVAPPGRCVSRLQSVARRLRPLDAVVTRLLPVRTEFDGCYESYSPPAGETRLWIRALLQRSA